MLTIQRASAGSGKTYTLARTYIQLLLTIKRPDGSPRLRTHAEVGDSLRHILAVTFTNKATAEMKQRIIDRLADLAAIEHRPLPADRKEWPDYLAEITDSTGAAPKEIAAAASCALRCILYSYSDFNVSTIDSFFQTILRTFAYETDLNDSYQLEIDSRASNAAGLDATLDAIANGEDRNASAWLKILMDRRIEDGQKWDPYQKGKSKFNFYNTLLKYAGRLESEQFKSARIALDNYFSSGTDLLAIYRQLDQKYREPAEKAFREMGRAAAILKKSFDDADLDISVYGSGYLESRLRKALGKQFDIQPFKPSASPFSSKKDLREKIAGCKDKSIIEENYAAFREAAEAWKEALDSEAFRLWSIYRELLPYVPLLHNVSSRIHSLLEQQNSMQISDTNTLLSRIIGDDETPFIYERLGAVINHYLIDEFQDTSRQQWRNLRPLLSESLSHEQDFDSLIIGDAKQSIYRFRNADPELIISRVPSEFDHIPKGDSESENANHRSLHNIVEFNNGFFRFLSDDLSDDLGRLYNNVHQHPCNSEHLGFVRVKLYNRNYYKTDPATDDPSTDENTKIADLPQIKHAGNIVASILKRGYRQRDIAFLIRRNCEGSEIIDSLVAYNASLPPDQPKIEFISDESLLISGSRAVRIVIASLTAIARGLDSEAAISAPPEGKEGVRNVSWSDISARYAYAAAHNPDEEPGEVLRSIMSNEPVADELSEMLQTMESVTLPSLTEAITERFVSRELRRQDSVFLAAFQDTVMNYCESRPADIASFLDWWATQADSLCISSPEGIDAVRIMTIHTSKGLEFPVVIMPLADFSLNNVMEEWHWLQPSRKFPEADLLPGILPVTVSKTSLAGTEHEGIYTELQEKVTMDNLNLAYVAFTRAVNELYIYSHINLSLDKDGNPSVGKRKTLGNMLYEYLNDQQEIAGISLQGGAYLDDNSLSPITFGSPLSKAELDFLREKKRSVRKIGREKTEIKTRVIDDYRISSESALLRYKPADGYDDTDPGADMRDEGNLMHDIMARVVEASDLSAAVKHFIVRGAITPEEGEAVEKRLSAAIESVKERGWFEPGLRVLNERSIVSLGRGRRHQISRPDRVVIDKEGNAIVIDYKFGHHTDQEQYRLQISRYMRALRASGRFHSVRGYLWYVTESEIEDLH